MHVIVEHNVSSGLYVCYNLLVFCRFEVWLFSFSFHSVQTLTLGALLPLPLCHALRAPIRQSTGFAARGFFFQVLFLWVASIFFMLLILPGRHTFYIPWARFCRSALYTSIEETSNQSRKMSEVLLFFSFYFLIVQSDELRGRSSVVVTISWWWVYNHLVATNRNYP